MHIKIIPQIIQERTAVHHDLLKLVEDNQVIALVSKVKKKFLTILI